MLKLFTVLLILISTNANAYYFRWPWLYHHARHHHIRSHRSSSQTITPPNCDQINAEVKRIGPERYERALRSATLAEQKAIAQCEVVP